MTDETRVRRPPFSVSVPEHPFAYVRFTISDLCELQREAGAGGMLRVMELLDDYHVPTLQVAARIGMRADEGHSKPNFDHVPLLTVKDAIVNAIAFRVFGKDPSQAPEANHGPSDASAEASGSADEQRETL